METEAKPSSGLFAALILLLPLTFAAAVGAGLLLWAVEHYADTYLVVAFPIIAGALVGVIAAAIVRLFKIRAMLFITVVCLLAGVILMATYHFATYYLTFRQQAREVIVERTGEEPTDADLDSFIDDLLESEGKQKGFVGFMQLNAEEGFTISRSTSSSSSGGIELKDTLAWVYWGVEILLAGAIAASMARKRAAALTPAPAVAA